MTARAPASHTLLTMAVALVTLPVLARPAAAAQDGLDDGSEPGNGFSVIETLFWFVVAPGLLFLVIAVLVSIPSMVGGPRYRPGLGWWAAPVWFNGPASAETAVRQATPTVGGGGSSARW